jgi:hypothetical protein
MDHTYDSVGIKVPSSSDTFLFAIHEFQHRSMLDISILLVFFNSFLDEQGDPEQVCYLCIYASSQPTVHELVIKATLDTSGGIFA